MREDVKEYLALPYVIEVIPEVCTDGSLCYRAYHPELPGCMSHGLTPEEAVENLSEAKFLYIQTLLDKGLTVPKPQKPSATSTGVSYEKAIWSVYTCPSVREDQETIKSNLPKEVPA